MDFHFDCVCLSNRGGSWSDDESPRHQQNAHFVYRALAHLDTQWRWEFPQTSSEYLLKTMRVNFDSMDKYPHYLLNWTGANRYRLIRTGYLEWKSQ